MKTKTLLTLIAITVSSVGNAQTNTFPSNGNVGIGTTNPSSKLHIIPGNTSGVSLAGRTVQYGVTVKPTSGRMGYAVVANNSYLSPSNDSSAFGYYHPFDASNANAGYKVFRIASGIESGPTNNSATTILDRFYVRKDGGAYFESNVGIGTTNPTNALAVNGTIRAKEIIVETGWSDFVFEETYRLRSLDEVESHIEKHGHLPDVPSAAIVESEGLSVGEAQKFMMQKIEELTLYMIEKDKQVTALQKQVHAQQIRIQELETN